MAWTFADIIVALLGLKVEWINMINYDHMYNVVKTIINHLGMVNIPPIKMLIWGMVYYCFTNYI